MAKAVSQTELMEALKQSIYTLMVDPPVNPETGEVDPMHPRDLAAVGNLIFKLQEREDKRQEELAKQSGSSSNVVAFPALPAIKRNA